MEDKAGRELTSVDEKKRPKEVSAMVPLFSRRSLITLAIGFIVGAALGLGYWAISSSHNKMWESNVNIQALSPGSSYISMINLQSRAEFYANKARGYPFLRFLSQELQEQAPDYSYSIDELNRMIRIEYNQFGLTPAFNMVVSTHTSNKTAFLASYIPEAFIKYITSEDAQNRQDTYQNTLESIESAEKALHEAEQEQSEYQAKIAASDIQNTPSYLGLNARIDVLESELQVRSDELAALVIAGSMSDYNRIREQEYQQTLQQARNISSALAETEQELRSLEGQRGDVYHDVAITTLNTKIAALEAEIDRYMVGYTETPGDPTTRVRGLAEMIATGTTESSNYLYTLEKIEAASTALAEAKEELALLESQAGIISLEANPDYQLAQAKAESLRTELSTLTEEMVRQLPNTVEGESQQEIQAAFESASLALSEAKKELAVLESQASSSISENRVGYQIAQVKVENLSRVLSSLNSNLASLTGDANASDVTDSLAVGKPAIPTPVSPVALPTALLVGVVIGVGGGWLLLNYKWLIKVLSSSPEEDKDNVGGE